MSFDTLDLKCIENNNTFIIGGDTITVHTAQ